MKQVPLDKTKLKAMNGATLTQLYAEIVLTPEPIMKLYQAVKPEITFEGETESLSNMSKLVHNKNACTCQRLRKPNFASRRLWKRRPE